jgi:hypothetical protein
MQAPPGRFLPFAPLFFSYFRLFDPADGGAGYIYNCSDPLNPTGKFYEALNCSGTPSGVAPDVSNCTSAATLFYYAGCKTGGFANQFTGSVKVAVTYASQDSCNSNGQILKYYAQMNGCVFIGQSGSYNSSYSTCVGTTETTYLCTDNSCSVGCIAAQATPGTSNF